MSFHEDIDYRVEEWMAGCHERSRRFAVDIHLSPVEADALVALEDRISPADQPVTAPEVGGKRALSRTGPPRAWP